MPSRQQVRALIEQGFDYAAIGRRLGIPAGQAYLVATGLPADGGAPDPQRPDPQRTTGGDAERTGALTSAQHLVGPPAVNPTAKGVVREWIRNRVAADAPMQAAARARRATASEE